LNPQNAILSMDITMFAPVLSVRKKEKVVDLTKSLRPTTTDMNVEKNSSEEEEFGEASSFLSQEASAVQLKFPSEMAEGLFFSDVTGASPTRQPTKPALTRKVLDAARTRAAFLIFDH